MVETANQKLEVFLNKIVKVIKERYDLDTQTKLSDLVYKFYFSQSDNENVSIFEDSKSDNFDNFVALKYLKEKYIDFLSSNKKFISLDHAYDIVKRINSILKKPKRSLEISFSESRMVDDVIFFIENSNIDSHYYSIYVNDLRDDEETEEISNTEFKMYLDHISNENKHFLSSLSYFAISKLNLSVKNILMPRVNELGLTRTHAAKILNECIDELRKEAELGSIELIENMFK
ncbi:MAG: hypothetical protein NZZ41_07410, partial [Candidatus Dojkabacteria bacterium]|nr:hypothetical protein [Candidatus Dojkabacteria bacterium]